VNDYSPSDIRARVSALIGKSDLGVVTKKIIQESAHYIISTKFADLDYSESMEGWEIVGRQAGAQRVEVWSSVLGSPHPDMNSLVQSLLGLSEAPSFRHSHASSDSEILQRTFDSSVGLIYLNSSSIAGGSKIAIEVPARDELIELFQKLPEGTIQVKERTRLL
jgi:hypothetical protein